MVVGRKCHSINILVLSTGREGVSCIKIKMHISKLQRNAPIGTISGMFLVIVSGVRGSLSLSLT